MKTSAVYKSDRYRVPGRLRPLAQSADDLCEVLRLLSRDCLEKCSSGTQGVDIRQVRELTAAIKDLSACVRSLRHLPEPSDETAEQLAGAKLRKALIEDEADPDGALRVEFGDNAGLAL